MPVVFLTQKENNFFYANVIVIYRSPVCGAYFAMFVFADLPQTGSFGDEAMMKTLILVCALATARPDCNPDTAMAVVQGPDAGGLANCGFVGQAYLADTALASYLDGEHYLKILCTAGDRFDLHRADIAGSRKAAEVVR